MAISKCPCSNFTNAMFKQIPRSHWFLSINLQYLQPYWLLQQTSQHTKPQRYKATMIHTLTPLTYELFLQNSSKSQSACDVQSHSWHVKVSDFAPFRRSYVREFELSHSNLVNRIVKITHAHNLHVKMLQNFLKRF